MVRDVWELPHVNITAAPELTLLRAHAIEPHTAVIQAKKCDPQGEYIKKWVPE